jgi:hypothetical protein
MRARAFDRAVLSRGLAQMAQLVGTYDSKTDQTAQSDQGVELADQFGAPPGEELTGRNPKPTSETAQQPHPRVQAIGAPLDCTDACTSDGAPQP